MPEFVTLESRTRGIITNSAGTLASVEALGRRVIHRQVLASAPGAVRRATVGPVPRRPGPPSPAQVSSLAPPRIYRARDHLRAEVAAGLRSGTWEQLRPGAYVQALSDADPFTRRRLRALGCAVAIAAKTTGAFMFSHETAALLHGLPLVGQGNVTHLFQNFRPGPRDAEDVRRRFLPVLPEHTTRHGLPVTSLERTLVDCAMSLGRRNGLVIADAAL